MPEEVKRTAAEIAYAHDTIFELLRSERDQEGEDGEELDPLTVVSLKASIKVLCWIFGHGDFAKELTGVERELRRRGYVRASEVEELALGGKPS